MSDEAEGCGCLIIAFIVVFAIGACIADNKEIVPVEEKIENVSRVMMHDTSKFTLYVEQMEHSDG
jgi:hypothetical protein